MLECKTSRPLSPEERNNTHFHSVNKGCHIVKRWLTSKSSPYYTVVGYCKTHHKDICHCGWEWEWHYGKHYPSTNKISQYKIVNKKPKGLATQYETSLNFSRQLS